MITEKSERGLVFNVNTNTKWDKINDKTGFFSLSEETEINGMWNNKAALSGGGGRGSSKKK